jgi:hypothetical protein
MGILDRQHVTQEPAKLCLLDYGIIHLPGWKLPGIVDELGDTIIPELEIPVHGRIGKVEL